VVTEIFWELCIIDIVKELPEKFITVPVMCSIPPFCGPCELPVQHGFIEAVMVGVIVTLPELSIETDDAMFMSRLRTIGEAPRVRLGLKFTFAAMAPGTDFCTSCIVVGSI
jgi:hypothetical protein